MGQLKNKYNPLLEKGIQKIINTDLLYFDATVGVGGDYPANDVSDGLSQALADGHVNVIIISDISLFANITQSNVIINIKEDFTLSTNSYSLTGSNISVNGIGGSYNYLTYSQAKISFTGSYLTGINFGNGAIFENLTILANIDCVGGMIKNSILNNCVLEFANTININAIGENTTLNHCKLIGTGTSCYGFFTGDNIILNDVDFLGTFGLTSVTISNNITINRGYNDATNLSINVNDAFGVKGNRIEAISGIWTQCNIEYTGLPNVNRENIKAIDCNVYIANGLIFDSSATKWEFDNCIFINGKPMRANKPTSLIFRNCKNIIGTTDITYVLDCDVLKISNCIISNNIYISGSNANINNNTLENGTITVNATADKTTLIGNRTLTSIVDNGTNTQLIANNSI